LFAAFLSAFLTASLPLLQPRNDDITVAVIIHMSRQLSNLTSPSNTPFKTPPFTPPKSAVIVNALFFASLALILSAAFLAILVKSWLREFDRGMLSITLPELRAKERESRLLSLEQWRVPELMALLPIFLQASLALFCVGLVIFLQTINSVIATIALTIFAIMAALWVLTNFASLFDDYSPFSSLISRALRDWLQIVGWEIPKMWAKWVRHLKSLLINKHVGYWPLAGIAVAVFPFCVMGHLILIISRAVLWYPRLEILKRKRDHQNLCAVRATVPSLNRLEKVTVKAPENTEIFLSIFDEALLRSVALEPSSRWADVLECLVVGENDLSLKHTRILLRVIAFVPNTWEVPILSLPLTPVILRQLEENISHPVDIPLYYLLQTLLRGVTHINILIYDDALFGWHWNQMCAEIANLDVCDDETLCLVVDLAKLAGRQDLSARVTDRCLPLLFAITTCLQTAMSKKSLEKTKLMPLIVATLQSFSITARSNIPPFPPMEPSKEGSDLFGTSLELRLETINFRALQQAWLSAPDGERHNIMALYILPINAIIYSAKQLYPDTDNLDPLLPYINQGPETSSISADVFQQLTQVSAFEYDNQVLLQTYDNWVVEDVTRITSSALDGLGKLGGETLEGYEARSPWLRLYIDIRLARPTMLQLDEIKDVTWRNDPTFDSIANIRISDYEDGKLSPEPALLELFSQSWSLETHFRLFRLLGHSESWPADSELAGIVPSLTDQLVGRVERVIRTTFHEKRFQPWTVRELESYFFLMETIHPQWGTLSPKWRKAFAREFFDRGFTTYLKEVSALFETYFERKVLYRRSASRTTQPTPRDSAGTVTGEPITLVEKESESRTETLRDNIQSYHEKWKAAACAYLPFLANVLQEAPEHITKDVVARIRKRLRRLPDYFGGESTRSQFFGVLERVEGMIKDEEPFEQVREGPSE